jgi:hypothetical protein
MYGFGIVTRTMGWFLAPGSKEEGENLAVLQEVKIHVPKPAADFSVIARLRDFVPNYPSEHPEDQQANHVDSKTWNQVFRKT